MRALLVAVAVTGGVGAVGALGACGSVDGPEPVTFCLADGLLGPDGETYGRDPEQGCRFVDPDGKPITTLADGSPLCYDEGMAAVPCE